MIQIHREAFCQGLLAMTAQWKLHIQKQYTSEYQLLIATEGENLLPFLAYVISWQQLIGHCLKQDAELFCWPFDLFSGGLSSQHLILRCQEPSFTKATLCPFKTFKARGAIIG